MTGTFFYEDGLYFSCKRCSSCCRHESGYVYISGKDLEKLCEMLKMNEMTVITTYCRWVNNHKGGELLSLKEKSNYDCIFWDSSCSVYESRPLQCRTFPFWDNILSSEYSWKTAASGCPGMNSGELHEKYEIENCLKIRSDEPVLEKREN
jgi:Fe-S-cluster containining protein